MKRIMLSLFTVCLLVILPVVLTFALIVADKHPKDKAGCKLVGFSGWQCPK